MRVLLSPEARDEFSEAERYYEEQLPGLGARFRDEVRVALRRARVAALQPHRAGRRPPAHLDQVPVQALVFDRAGSLTCM